ncbi:MAG: type II secretion system protein [Lachnospiraceae bacterium]|nr:type II secretion system protein [Lachnospiraceae bacterium]
MKKMRNSRRGFTLTEIILVVAIIVLLSSVSIVGIAATMTKAKNAQLKLQTQNGDNFEVEAWGEVNSIGVGMGGYYATPEYTPEIEAAKQQLDEEMQELIAELLEEYDEDDIVVIYDSEGYIIDVQLKPDAKPKSESGGSSSGGSSSNGNTNNDVGDLDGQSNNQQDQNNNQQQDQNNNQQQDQNNNQNQNQNQSSGQTKTVGNCTATIVSSGKGISNLTGDANTQGFNIRTESWDPGKGTDSQFKIKKGSDGNYTLTIPNHDIKWQLDQSVFPELWNRTEYTFSANSPQANYLKDTWGLTLS